MGKYSELAKEAIEAVGGRTNISDVAHCMTRLRFYIKDLSAVNTEALKNVKGVVGVQTVGNEIQAIIGTQVEKVYNDVVEAGGFEKKEVINENLDAPDTKKAKGVKAIFNEALDILVGSITPCLPAFYTMGFLKMVAMILGPEMLGLISETSNTYQIMTVAYDSVMYFLPFMLAYTASKKLGTQTVVSIMLAGILMSNGLMGIVAAGQPFAVFGIPMKLVNYSNSILPIVFIVYAQKWLEKFFGKILPEALITIFQPLCIILVLLPLGLCVLGPIGSWISELIAGAMGSLYEVAAPVETLIVGGLFAYIIAFGLGYAPFVVAMMQQMQTGKEYWIMPINAVFTYALIGVSLAFLIKCSKKEKAEASTCFFSIGVTGISEPTIYGILLKHKKLMLVTCLGSAIGSCWLGINHCALVLGGGLPLSYIGFFKFMGFIESKSALINGFIACIAAFLISFIGSLLVYKKEKQTTERSKEL